MKMKIPGYILILASAFLFVSVPAGGLAAEQKQTLQQVFESAKEAYYRGDYESAKAGFTRVLQADPRHSYSRAYLAQIMQKTKNPGPTGAAVLEGRMAGVIAPSIDFQEATLGSVIEFIPEKTAELTKKEFTPSIIYKGAPEELTQKKVTLRLSNVPMSEVLRYVGELTQIQFKYEQYAIVAMPLRDVPVVEVKEAKQGSSTTTTKGKDPFGGEPAKDPFK